MLESLRLAAAVVTAGTFVVSGVAKFRTGRFISDLANYRLLPAAWVIPIGLGMPYLEIAVGVLPLAWFTSAIPIYVAAGLLTVFAAAMTVNLARGRQVACGCGGTNKPISWSLVAADAVKAMTVTLIAALHPPVSGLTLSEGIATVGAVGVAALGMRLAQQTRQLRTTSRRLGFGLQRAIP